MARLPLRVAERGRGKGGMTVSSHESIGVLVGVTAARGFVAGGLACGVKTREGALDLGLVLSDRPAAAAGVFTQNRAAAAPCSSAATI